MLKYLICLILLLCLLPNATAQNWDGLVLINVVDVGAIDSPNHLYLADVGSSDITEFLVENESFFTPWYDWSPDGEKFAYLAPARRGINYELWLGDANINAPVPRAVLFNLDLNVLTAAWNPLFNIIAVGTESQGAARDGLYLVNGNFENIVFLDVVDLPRNGILDWSHSGTWLSYATENAALEMINTETRSVVTLRSFTQPSPARLPKTPTGWTQDDQYYVFSDDIFQTIYAVTADGFSNQGQIHPDFIFDPFDMQIRPNTNQILALDNTSVFLNNLATGELDELNLGQELGFDAFFAADGALIVNSFISLPDGDFEECLHVNLETGNIQFMREILNDSTLAHTHCLPLEGGAYWAVMASDRLEPLQALPSDLTYNLFLVSDDLQTHQWITDQYIEQTPLGFSEKYRQLILPIEDALIVYNVQGDSKTLIRFSEMGLKSSFPQFEFKWQP